MTKPDHPKQTGTPCINLICSLLQGTRLNSHISSISCMYLFQKQSFYLLIFQTQTLTEDNDYPYYRYEWVALHLPAVHTVSCSLVPKHVIFILKEDQIQSSTEQAGLCCSSLGPLWNPIFCPQVNMAVTWVWISNGLGLMLSPQKQQEWPWAFFHKISYIFQGGLLAICNCSYCGRSFAIRFKRLEMIIMQHHTSMVPLLQSTN